MQPSFKESVTAHSVRDFAPQIHGAKHGTETEDWRLNLRFDLRNSKGRTLASDASGRRVFASARRGRGCPTLGRCEVRLLAKETTRGVKTPHAERTRFPSQRLS